MAYIFFGQVKWNQSRLLPHVQIPSGRELMSVRAVSIIGIHGHHRHRILDDINTYARRIDNYYTGTPPYTAGYACPGDNDHASNSPHIYGKALDWDGGGDNESSSRINYNVFVAAKKVSGITPYLYDNKTPRPNRYDRSVVPPWPNKPPGFVGTHYRSGHADW